MLWGFFRGGSKRPLRMLKFFSGGKVEGQEGKKGVNQIFKEEGPLGRKFTES